MERSLAYNSVYVALFSASLGDLTGIRVVDHSHNEPGHGSDICDTAGSNSVRNCMRFTKRTGVNVDAASVTQTALTQADMDGFVCLLTHSRTHTLA